jgi:hypothetical protein
MKNAKSVRYAKGNLRHLMKKQAAFGDKLHESQMGGTIIYECRLKCSNHFHDDAPPFQSISQLEFIPF